MAGYRRVQEPLKGLAVLAEEKRCHPSKEPGTAWKLTGNEWARGTRRASLPKVKDPTACHSIWGLCDLARILIPLARLPTNKTLAILQMAQAPVPQSLMRCLFFPPSSNQLPSLSDVLLYHQHPLRLPTLPPSLHLLTLHPTPTSPTSPYTTTIPTPAYTNTH